MGLAEWIIDDIRSCLVFDYVRLENNSSNFNFSDLPKDLVLASLQLDSHEQTDTMCEINYNLFGPGLVGQKWK